MQFVTAHGAEVEALVPAALEVSFRDFDTAQIYENEATLGRALKAAVEDRATRPSGREFRHFRLRPDPG